MLLETGRAVGLDTGDMSGRSKSTRYQVARINDACNALICLGAIMSYFNAIGALGADALQDLRHDGGIYVLFGRIRIYGLDCTVIRGALLFL